MCFILSIFVFVVVTFKFVCVFLGVDLNMNNMEIGLNNYW